MRFNFKKIASVLASAAMLGSTMGMAAAANYPDPFVKGGVANVAIVVGASAATIDNIAAVDVASNLQEELAKQTATVSSTGASGTGGDNVNLATSSQKLYFNSTLSSARTGVTKQEMPTILADSKVIDDAGTEYSYKQSINPGARFAAYSTSGGDLTDPALVIEVGTDSNTPLYQYSLTMNKNLNISSSDVQGNNIQILGKDYTIGSGSTIPASGSKKLILFGAGTEKTLNEGESATVEIGDKTYTVEMKSVEQTGSVNYVSVSVDGGTVRRIQEGTSSKVGSLEVYAKTVHYLAKEAQVSYADLNIGSTKITLQDAASVKLGSDETSVYGTYVQLSASADKLLSALKVNVSMTKATKDYIKSGESFEDPVFGGLTTQFVGANPTLDATARDSVKIDSDNSRNAKVTFTSALAGEAGAKTIYFAHDDTDADSGIRTLLADSANKTIHVVENESIYINEYAVINAGDYGRIIRLIEIPTGDLDTNSKIQFEDVVTGQNLFDGGLVLGSDGEGSTNIDGNTYYFHAINSSTAANNYVVIDWGASSAEGNFGSAKTVFPRIKLAKGGWIAFLSRTNVSSATKSDIGTLSLPGLETLADYESGLAILNNSAKTTLIGSKKFGNVNYTIDFTAANNDTIIGIDVDEDGTLVAGTDCLFNSTTENGAAILLLEEKKTTETNNANNGDVICVNIDTSGSTSPVELSVSKPVVTGIKSGLVTLTSDSNKQEEITRYGSFIKYDATDNDAVSISYPDEQMYIDVLLAATGTEVTAGSSGGSVASLGSVAVMDSEIATVNTKNLLVVGGSCINTVAAKVLGSDSPLCGADFTTKTNISSGQFLVKVVDSPYTTGKIAMLVAGYEGADTRKAATYLTSNKPSTVVGTELKKQTATYADVV